ncbi:MAG: PAS domain-containing protein [Elusimicrobia bacterium]|nr:PAS domain-containing protein [Elusimicrobiota bacterium]MDE2426520.1 PAS domain-containing protein [Elusimicrobiota bacterium]
MRLNPLGRFQRRLGVSFCLILLASTVVLNALVTRAFRTQRIDDLSRALAAQARLAAELTRRARPLASEMPRLARKLAAICSCRITILSKTGSALADSQGGAVEPAGAAEVAAALRGGTGHAVRNDPTQGELLYTAVPLPGIGALRCALPLSEVDLRAARLRRDITTISLAILIVAMALTLWLSASLARPLEGLTDMAERLSRGDYATRLRVSPNDEHRRLAEALNVLGETVQRTVQALERDRGQLEAILDSIVEAVAAVDAQGRLIAANPALRRLLVLPEPFQGRSFTEALRHPKLQDLLDSVLKEGRARVDEIAGLGHGDRHFEAHAVALQEAGRRTGALLVLHDITRLRRLEQMRREFVANVSHELRTPLASIQGFAETLREGAVDDRRHRMEFIAAIEQDAKRLSALVEDLLALSAIESGQRPPSLGAVDVLELAREVAAALKPLAERQHVSLAVAESPQPPLALADRDQLKQVLTNLLDNAVKFNREGGRVEVSASIAAGRAEVRVVDTGPGIPAEDLPRVFERFYRVDKARSREVGGTGLGLAIVRHIVEAHGGSVSVESRLGEGSRFRFTIPLAPRPGGDVTSLS